MNPQPETQQTPSSAAQTLIPAPESFVWLSSQLVHVRKEWIKPAAPPDGVQLCDVYYNVLLSNTEELSFGEITEDLEAWYLDGKLPENLLSVSGRASDDVSAWAARMTMMMWLFGMWMGETEHERLERKTEKFFSANASGKALKDYVISSRAYENGWIWKIAQAHPMGISQFAFGSWTEKPPELSDYGFDELA